MESYSAITRKEIMTHDSMDKKHYNATNSINYPEQVYTEEQRGIWSAFYGLKVIFMGDRNLELDNEKVCT